MRGAEGEEGAAALLGLNSDGVEADAAGAANGR
jgi:hypothetical protein